MSPEITFTEPVQDVPIFLHGPHEPARHGVDSTTTRMPSVGESAR
jgi:hypothetical protein